MGRATVVVTTADGLLRKAARGAKARAVRVEVNQAREESIVAVMDRNIVIVAGMCLGKVTVNRRELITRKEQMALYLKNSCVSRSFVMSMGSEDVLLGM